MDLRKALSLCVAVALIAGFASPSAEAAVASPSGIWIQVTNPATGTWLKIDDTLRVRILALKDVADTMVCAVVVDTSATAVEAINLLRGGGSAGTPRGRKNLTTTGNKVILADSLHSPSGSSSTVDTFRFKFGVTGGDAQSAANSTMSILAFVDRSANGTSGTVPASFEKLSNLNTADQIVGGSTGYAAIKVGDGKTHGEDGQRPVVGVVIDSIRIDTAGTGTIAYTPVLRTIKSGSEISVKLALNVGQVLNSNATSVQVVLIKSTQAVNVAAAVDSNLLSSPLVFNSVYTDSQAIQVTIAAGDFANNTRITPAAFLVDQAGNLGGTTADAVAPAGVTAGVVYLADSTVPVITIDTPNADSSRTRFTDVVSRSLSLRNDAGTVAATTFAAQALKMKSSEAPASTTAEFNDSTLTITGTTTMTEIATDFGIATQGGKSENLTVAVTDSAGNKTTKTVSSVYYDQVVPAFTQIFPTRATVPTDEGNSNKPTINATTKNPVVRLKEVLDSISVRYVQIGASPPDVATYGLKGHADLAKVGEDIELAMTDTLLTGFDYTLQVVQIDLANNAATTAVDTMTYTKAFQNPVADSFVVAAANDSTISDQAFDLDLTAIDTALTTKAAANVKAVTYGAGSKLTINVAEGETDKLAGITFEGTGVSVASTDTGRGIATLDSDGWVVGFREMKFRSLSILENFSITLTDTTALFDATLDSLVVDAAEMSAFTVTAMEADVAVTGVSGEFEVHVVATDENGNPSMKTRASGVAITDSTSLLDSRISDADALEEIFVEFSANAADAQVPAGPQAFDGDATFTVVAPDRTGDGLVIGVRAFNGSADTTGVNVATNKHLKAAGSSAALGFVPFGEEPVTPTVGAPAAPDTLIVQDYMGADGAGDQGGFVIVSFPQSDDHGAVSQYRLYRMVSVSTGMDADGKVVALTTPTLKYVPWTVIDAVPAPAEDATSTIVRAVVPTLDKVATSWAVTAEKGGTTSERTAAAKRVFTKESVQQMVSLLGVDPNRVLANDELIKQFNAPKDYVKSILGDQKNVTFAALDPDLNALLGTTTVPTSIRTDGGKIISSARTVTAAAVAAVDNIPPAAVTDADGAKSSEGVDLTWTSSADDKIVAYSSYRGFAVPIAGVDRYEVLRGATEDDLELVATLPAGSASFADTDLPSGAVNLVYRVDALDLDNLTAGSPISVNLGGDARQKFVDADGNPVYIVSLTDSSPLKVDFTDFVAFAQSYQLSTGEAGFNIQADTNDDGTVGFVDFVAFAQSYQREAVGPASKLVSVPAQPGVNDNAEMLLSLTSDRVLAGETVSVDVSIANTTSLYGYGLTLTYDPSKFELVDAVPAENDILKTTGGETPLFNTYTDEVGKVTLMNAVINGDAATGDGSIVTVTFRVLREFEDNARFVIAEGLVFDPKGLANPAVTLGALNVETTPTEFSLLQNYPNPFNPETTIKYNLAETANVQLRIYNIVGQVVKTVVADRQAAGRYQVRWSGTDDRGVAVSSGIYFYQISAGKFQDVKRLMLLK